MSFSVDKPLTVRVTRSAYPGKHSVVFNAVEVDSVTLHRVNVRQYYIVKVENTDPDLMVENIHRGMIMDIQPESKLYAPSDGEFERFIITPQKLVLLRPRGQLIVDLIGGSSKFKGIGPVKAKKLWSRFGDSLYEILNNAEEKSLTGVLKPAIAENLIEAWRTYVNIEAMRFCNVHLNLDVGVSFRASEFYREETEKKLSEDPFRLLAFGVTFKKCDAIRKRLGFKTDAQIRLAAALEESLYSVLNRGSTVADHETLKPHLIELLDKEENDENDEPLSTLALQQGFDCDNYVLLDNGLYQSNGAFVMESLIAERIHGLMQTSLQISNSNRAIKNALQQYQSENGMLLNQEQIKAVHEACSNRFFIINGGAGVGKTTVLKAIYTAFHEIGLAPIQVALSGKAAKRMSEATGYDAYTIARFIKAFDFSLFNEQECVLVIDESSMVDIPSMYRLFKFIPKGTRIILLGDTGQLPPVDFGLVLHELIDLEFLPKVTLTRVLRQGSNSNIPSVAQCIREGAMPPLDYDDVYLIPVLGATKIKKKCAELYLEDSENSQIICPTNRAVNEINALCSAPNEGDIVKVFVEECDREMNTDFKVGDKVMCCRNLYESDLMNGSTGVVIEAYDKARPVQLIPESPAVTSYGRILWDDDVYREITIDVINSLKLAYAMTIHKSQGSQFPVVIIPIEFDKFVDKRMLYTAVTRAQRKVIFVGKVNVIGNILKNISNNSRKADLGNKLQVLFFGNVAQRVGH